MIIRVSEIPDEGLDIDSPVDLEELYPEAGWSLTAIRLRVERREQDVRVSGRFEATAGLACGRCLEPLVVRVEPEVDVSLVPVPRVRQGETELGGGDLERDFYQGDALDLAALLRGETDLALPMKPLCRDDCRGLCPVCGGNRNLADCHPETRGVDPRLAPLEALRRLP